MQKRVKVHVEDSMNGESRDDHGRSARHFTSALADVAEPRNASGVPVRALGTRARCVPVMSGTGGHSRSLAVTRNPPSPGARSCDLHWKEA